MYCLFVNLLILRRITFNNHSIIQRSGYRRLGQKSKVQPIGELDGDGPKFWLPYIKDLVVGI